MSNQLIRVGDAARRLGVSYATLKQWIYKGTLRTVQTAGGHHRISESELERFLARPSTGSGRPERAEGRKGPASASLRRGKPRSKKVPTVLVALSGRNQLRGVVEEVRTDG